MPDYNDNVKQLKDPEEIILLIQKLIFMLPNALQLPLVRLCQDKGASQDEIAQALGLSRPAISNRFPKSKRTKK